MSRCSSLAAGALAVVLSLLLMTSAARAADETATSSLSMSPLSGKLYRNVAVPVSWQVGVEIKAPYPASPRVSPMKEIHAKLPRDMSFNPDPRMDVCPDDKIGPSTNLSFPPDTIIPRCPTAVLGNGTAGHYLAQINSPNGPTLTDAAVVIFNGGRTSEGLPKIKIYGYSAGASAGIYMEGVLDDGQLDVSLPALPFDSATGEFHLSIPGRDESHKNRRGLDPAYVRSTCSTGAWTGQVDFLLGSRDTAGNAIGPESNVFAPPLKILCLGVTAKARLAKVRIKGPRIGVAGRRAAYRVTFANRGIAPIKRLRISASGKGVKGRAHAGNLAAGRSKTAKLKVRFSKQGRTRVRFRIAGKGIRGKTVVRQVRVRKRIR